MPYHLTVKDIRKHTGLTINFIRRCLKEMPAVFTPHTARGENNTLLFDDNVYPLFDRIKQFKEQDKLTLPEIKKRLNYEPMKPDDLPDKLPSQTLSNRPIKPYETVSESSERGQNIIKELYERLLEERDKSYQILLNEKQQVIDSLKGSLNLLTDGRSLEEIRKEAEVKKKRKTEILDRLEELEGRWFKRQEKAALLQELRDLD